MSAFVTDAQRGRVQVRVMNGYHYVPLRLGAEREEAFVALVIDATSTMREDACTGTEWLDAALYWHLRNNHYDCAMFEALLEARNTAQTSNSVLQRRLESNKISLAYLVSAPQPFFIGLTKFEWCHRSKYDLRLEFDSRRDHLSARFGSFATVPHLYATRSHWLGSVATERFIQTDAAAQQATLATRLPGAGPGEHTGGPQSDRFDGDKICRIRSLSTQFVVQFQLDADGYICGNAPVSFVPLRLDEQGNRRSRSKRSRVQPPAEAAVANLSPLFAQASPVGVEQPEDDACVLACEQVSHHICNLIDAANGDNKLPALSWQVWAEALDALAQMYDP